MTGTKSRTKQRHSRRQQARSVQASMSIFAMNSTEKALIAVRALWHLAGCQQLLKEGA